MYIYRYTFIQRSKKNKDGWEIGNMDESIVGGFWVCTGVLWSFQDCNSWNNPTKHFFLSFNTLHWSSSLNKFCVILLFDFVHRFLFFWLWSQYTSHTPNYTLDGVSFVYGIYIKVSYSFHELYVLLWSWFLIEVL